MISKEVWWLKVSFDLFLYLEINYFIMSLECYLSIPFVTYTALTLELDWLLKLMLFL